MRWFSLVLLSACALPADVLIRQRGPYLTFGTDLMPGSSLNDVWVFSPMDPHQGLCLFMTNRHPSSQTTLTLNVYQSGDSNALRYTGNEYRFRQDSIQGTMSPIAPRSTNTVFVQTSAAARVAVQVTGSSGGGPVDFYAVQTNAGTCGPVSGGTTYVQGSQSVGTSATSNPVVIGGVDLNNIVQTAVLGAGGGTYSLFAVNPVLCVSGSVPTTETLATSQTQIWNITLANPSGNAITVTIKDNDATPVTWFSGPVNSNSTVIFNWFGRAQFSNGVRWSASAAGVNGKICYL